MLTAAETIEEMKFGPKPQDVYVCVVTRNNWREVESYCDTAVRISEDGVMGVKNRNGSVDTAMDRIKSEIARERPVPQS